MADQTISVLLDGELSRRTLHIAEGERRSQSAVVTSALNLYTALSPTAPSVSGGSLGTSRNGRGLGRDPAGHSSVR
jgi:hypothetical protein